jgi:hypothetical protein
VLVAMTTPLLLATDADALTHLGGNVTETPPAAQSSSSRWRTKGRLISLSRHLDALDERLQAMQAARTAGLGTSVIFITALADERISAHGTRARRERPPAAQAVRPLATRRRASELLEKRRHAALVRGYDYVARWFGLSALLPMAVACR